MNQKVLSEQRKAELLLAGQLHVSELSARELYIVRLVAWGYASKQIADMLNLSLHTVRQHMKNIHHVLNAHSTSDLTRWYFFREFGISESWRRIIATLLLIISCLSILELSCNVRVLRASPVGRVARAGRMRRLTAYNLSLT